MSQELKYLLMQAAKGRISRRTFLGKAAAAGVTGAMANTLLARAARAEGPKKGGIIRAGMQGGESTNSLDPALAASEAPFMTNMTWGEMLVNVTPDGQIDYRIAEDVSSSPEVLHRTAYSLVVRQ